MLPSTRQIVTSVDVSFDEQFISTLIHKNQAYCEVILTRPVNDSMTTFDHVTDKTGDITNTILPPSSTSLEEETAIDLNANDIDDCDILHLDNDDIASLSAKDESSQDEPTTAIDPPSPRGSNRVRRINNKHDESGWVSLAKEKKEEEMPWSHNGDPTLFIPEPKGLKTILKLEKMIQLHSKFGLELSDLSLKT